MSTKIKHCIKASEIRKLAIFAAWQGNEDYANELDDLFDAVSSGAFEAMGSIEETRDAWLVDRD
jgi:hypothetical protein